MSLFPLLTLLLVAPVELAGEDGERAKIIVLDLVNGADLSEARLEALGDAMVSALSGAPVEVLSAADLRKTVEVKASQSALGCIQGDCLLDLAKAWQARYLLTGSLASFKGQMILNLKLIDSNNENLKVLLRETHEAKPDALTALARISAAKMRQALGGPAPSEAEMAVLKAGKVPLLGLSLGLVGVTSLVFAGLAQSETSTAGEQALIHKGDRVVGPYYVDHATQAVSQARLLALASGLLLGAASYAWLEGY